MAIHMEDLVYLQLISILRQIIQNFVRHVFKPCIKSKSRLESY